MVSKDMVITNFIILIIIMILLKLCGAGLRILGGRDALKDEFPFAIRLEHQYTKTSNGKTEFEYYVQFCTGAALTPSWILTAAHCDDEDVLKGYNVFIRTKLKKVARYNSYFPYEYGQLSPVTKVLIYPGYDLFFELNGDVRVKNDIALFQTQNVRISQYAKISAIDYASLVGHEALLLGFGGNNATPMKKPLQVLKSILIKCDVREGKHYGMLCIVPRCGSKAPSCGGDSGGPVVHASGIVGVASGGSACDQFAQNIFPGYASGVISMTSPAVDWISNVLANKTAG